MSDALSTKVVVPKLLMYIGMFGFGITVGIIMTRTHVLNLCGAGPFAPQACRPVMRGLSELATASTVGAGVALIGGFGLDYHWQIDSEVTG